MIDDTFNLTRKMPARCVGRMSKVVDYVFNTTSTFIKLDIISFQNLKKKLVRPSCHDSPRTTCIKINKPCIASKIAFQIKKLVLKPQQHPMLPFFQKI